MKGFYAQPSRTRFPIRNEARVVDRLLNVPVTVRLAGSSRRTSTQADGPHETRVDHLLEWGKSSLFALLDIGMSEVSDANHKCRNDKR